MRRDKVNSSHDYIKVYLDPQGTSRSSYLFRVNARGVFGQVDTAAFNRAVFAALNPGGTYFVLNHQAPSGTTDAEIAKLHRIEKSKVIREVAAAGFRLAAEGTFLQHPNDDHTLPVSDDRIKGHTDQYSQRFLKPK